MKKVKMMMSKMNHKILMQIKSLCIGNLIRKTFLNLYDLDDHVSMEGRMNPLQTWAPHPLCLQKNVCTSLVVCTCMYNMEWYLSKWYRGTENSSLNHKGILATRVSYY